VTITIGLDKHASVDILWLIPVILAEYFEIWIIESNLNSYCLNCSESRDKVQHQVGQIYTVINIIKIKELAILPEMWANKSICSYSDFKEDYSGSTYLLLYHCAND
jgi:hypothetical protein